MVDRDFVRAAPHTLWVTDITEHPTREGKVYCAVVLDVHSRRVVGWSIDSSQTAGLATHALGMAISNSATLPAGTVIHSDHGVQFTSWTFTKRAKESGLLPGAAARRRGLLRVDQSEAVKPGASAFPLQTTSVDDAS